MLLKLFLIFSLIPVVEIYLIIKVGSFIGVLPTVILLLSISTLGAWLIRSQGFAILGRIRDEMAQGRLPAGPLLEGSLVLVGGLLLLTPGFFTDTLGLFFLFPRTRTTIGRIVVRWLQGQFMQGNIVIRRK